METPVWLVESSLYLEQPSPQNTIDFILPNIRDTRSHIINPNKISENVPEVSSRVSEDLSPLSSVYYLNYRPHSFVHWRLDQGRQILELRRVFFCSSSPSTAKFQTSEMIDDTSLVNPDSSLAEKVVRIHLPSPCLPWPAFFEEADNMSIHLLLMTQSGIFYRLVFPMPDLFLTSSLRIDDIMDGYRVASLRQRVPVMYHCPDLDTVIIGCGNGSLIQLDCPRAMPDMDISSPESERSRLVSYQEYDLVEANYISQLTSLIGTPSKLLSVFRTATGTVSSGEQQSSDGDRHATSAHTSAGQPIAMASLCYENALYTFSLSRDGKIRVWDLLSHTCVKSIPVSVQKMLLNRMDRPEPLCGISTSGSGFGNDTTSSTTKISTSLSSSSALLPSIPRKLLQIFNETLIGSRDTSFDPERLAFHLLCYIGKRGPERQGFVAFSGRLDPNGALMDLNPVWNRDTSAFADEFLLDFVVAKNQSDELSAASTSHGGYPHWTLWSTWDRRGVNFIRYTQIYLNNLDSTDRQTRAKASLVVGDRWMPVLTNPPASVEIPGFSDRLFQGSEQQSKISIQEIFLEHIFEPGRFPLGLIAEALDMDLKPPFSRSKLFQLVNDHVGQHLQFDDGLETISYWDYQSALSAAYSAFLARIVQLQTVFQRTTSICYDPLTKNIIVAKRGNGLGILRSADASEVIGWTTPGGLAGRLSQPSGGSFSLAMAPLCVFTGSLESLQSKGLRMDIQQFFKVAQYLSSVLDSSGIFPSLSQEWVYSRDPCNSMISDYVRTVYDRVQEQYADIWAEVLLKVRNGIQKIGHFQQLTRSLLDIFQQTTKHSSHQNSSAFANQAKPTDFSHQWIALGVKEMIDTRLHLLENMFPLLIVLRCIDLMDPQFEVPDSILSETLVLLNIYTRLSSLSSLYLQGTSLSDSNSSQQRRTHNKKKQLDVLSGFSELTVSGKRDTLDIGKNNTQEQWLLVQLLKHHFLLDLNLDLPSSPGSETGSDRFMTDDSSELQISSPRKVLSDIILDGMRMFLNQMCVLNPKAITMSYNIQGFVRLCHKLIVYGHGQVIAPLLRSLPRRSAAAEYLLALTWIESFEWDKAERCFEKAAIGVTHAVTVQGSKRNNREPESSSDSDSVHWLFKAIIGDSPTEGYTGSRGLIQYYTHIMNIFLERDVLDKAIHFGQLALSECTAPENINGSTETRLMLHNTLFKTALDMRDFDTAYQSLLNHPDTDAKRTCIRHFVTALCEHGDMDGLCSRYSFPKMSQEVEDALLFKARTSSVIETVFGALAYNEQRSAATIPNYFKICYAYLMYRGNVRAAALSMYMYARKVQNLVHHHRHQIQESHRGPSKLNEQPVLDENRFRKLLTELAQALLCSWNALGLVSIADQWISVEVESVVKEVVVSKKRQFSELIMDDHVDEEFEDSSASLAAHSQKLNRSMDIVSMSDIRKEYHLVDARLSLAQLLVTTPSVLSSTTFTSADLPAPTGGSSNIFSSLLSAQPIDLLVQFCRAGQFDRAFEFARLFDLDTDRIFVHLAEKCVSVSGYDTMEHNLRGAAWTDLKKKLEAHDAREQLWKLHVVVVQALLGRNKRIRLLSWLVMPLEMDQPSALLSLYMEHGRIEEAMTLATNCLERQMVGITRSTTSSSGLTSSTSSQPSGLPLHWIDALLRLCQSLPGSTSDLLKAEWQLYQNFVASSSQPQA